eukprot:gene14133-15610_t
MKRGVLKQSFICNCAFERNIFIKDVGRHFTFENEEQFATDYKSQLVRNGISDVQYQDIMRKIKEEIERRQSLGNESVKRKNIISQRYKHIHRDLLQLKRSHLSEQFLEVVSLASDKDCSTESLIQKLQKENAPHCYSFQVFTNEFCDKLIEEIESFEKSGLPIGKPNTMNNYGIVLSELGYKEGLFDPLVADYLNPIASRLFPDEVGKGLDSHRTFIVSYAIGKDTDLSYHYDDAEVTLNVALGNQFEGGELYLSGMKSEVNWSDVCYKYCHRKTWGLIHRGQQMHGAMPIEEGQRYNLIIWMRASSVRNQICPMCNRKPDLVSTEADGAGFSMEPFELCSTL